MGAGTTDRNMYTMKKALQDRVEEDEEGTSETLSKAIGYPVQAHHLICCSVMNDLKDGKMRDLAEDSGYDINEEGNGIALPAYFGNQRSDDLPRHRGGHCDDYYEKVKTELTKIYEDYEHLKPCDLDEKDRKDIRTDLGDLETFIRGKLLEKKAWWLLRNGPRSSGTKTIATRVLRR